MILGLSLYAAVFLFIGLSAYKAVEYGRMPLHGRMELYPVPAEKGRQQYGGSYMEEPEWWRKPRQVSKSSELIEMLKEMLFIKKLFDNQRSFWWISYALHIGIYFLMAWTILLVAGTLTDLAGASVSDRASIWTAFLYYFTVLAGWTGFVLATAGAVLLVIRRAFDPILKKYTTPQEYLNLLLLLAALVSGITVWSPDPTFGYARQATMDVLTLSIAPNLALLIHLIILEVTFIYIPLSKMSHYVGKYFSFHKVLWENEPNIAGSPMENQVKTALLNTANNTWAAPHIQPAEAPKSES
ncbi:MAG: respiratory nitrate reductase subunit gamma [Ignavibacteriales bacterium]